MLHYEREEELITAMFERRVTKMRKFLNWLMKEESGQGMVEYALIIGLIAIVLIVALGWVTGGIQAVFTKIQTTLNAV